MIEPLQSKILLVDDDSTFLRTTELFFQNSYDIRTANTVAQAQAILKSENIDTVVCDLNFQGQPKDGIFLLDWIADNYPSVPVLVLSGAENGTQVLDATRRKLVDFVLKSGQYIRNLRTAIEAALVRRKQILAMKSDPYRFKTKCPSILKYLDQIDQLALKKAEVPIFITGETGVGKEIMAKHISAAFKKSLIASNMANLNENTAESELFGHMKGAFTGAHSDKVGLIEQAHRGIFFLDELGDCSLSVQAKLLRVLDSGELRRVGGTQTKTVDVQFVSATNKNLLNMIQAGQFRRDLYARLSSLVIQLPPLRERPEDIEYYLNLFLTELSTYGTFTLSTDVLDAALSYHWPNNCRDLWNFVERTALLDRSKIITAEHLKEWIDSQGEQTTFQSATNFPEREQIIQAMNRAQRNRTQAAKLLGIDPSTLYRKIKRLHLETMFVSKPGRPSKL